MQYALECLESKVFNWSDAVLLGMREQLTKVKNRNLKNFGCGSILIAFALEKNPADAAAVCFTWFTSTD